MTLEIGLDVGLSLGLILSFSFDTCHIYTYKYRINQMYGHSLSK